MAATECGWVLQTCNLGGKRNLTIVEVLRRKSGEIDLQELPHGLAGFPFTLLMWEADRKAVNGNHTTKQYGVVWRELFTTNKVFKVVKNSNVLNGF